MFIDINISSKNFYSLNLFLTFFLKVLVSKKIKIKVFKKFKTVLKREKFFTVLKSPHITKIAQEHFKYDIFTYNIRIQSFQLLKMVYLFKNINTNIYTSVKIEFKMFFGNKKFKQKTFKILNVNNCLISIKNNSTFCIKNYLEILSLYGQKKLISSIV